MTISVSTFLSSSDFSSQFQESIFIQYGLEQYTFVTPPSEMVWECPERINNSLLLRITKYLTAENFIWISIPLKYERSQSWCFFQGVFNLLPILSYLKELVSKFIVGGDKRRSVGLGVLKDLNNLGGRLSIENLEKVGDARLESKAANLMGKRYLKELSLIWKDDDDAEILLEGLQPHPNLKELGIEGYGGASLPSWMMGNMVITLPNIVDISLWNCPSIRQLPPFHQLPNIVSIYLGNCPNIKQLPPFYQLPCLKTLNLVDLPKVEYGGDGDGDGSSSSSSSPSFPSLTLLTIYKCPMLTSMPLAPLLETLSLYYVSEKLVCQLLSSSPLARLSYLDIQNIEDLEALPTIILTSLKTLKIQRCPRLLRLAEIQHLTALEDLQIEDCEEVDLSEDGTNWQALCSLRMLVVHNLPKLVSLPEGLQHVTTLQIIIITDCPGLVALPEWMSKLTSLKDLQIYGCPLLNERCQKDTGEDWPNIAHIPIIYINGESVQVRY